MSVAGASLIPTIIGVGVSIWGEKQKQKAAEKAMERGIGYLEGATKYEMQAKAKAYPEWWDIYAREIAPMIGKESPLLKAALEGSLTDISQLTEQGVLESGQFWESQGMLGRGRGERQRMRRAGTRAAGEARFQEAIGQEGFKAGTLQTALTQLSTMAGMGTSALPVQAQIAQLLTSMGGVKGSVYDALSAGVGDIVGTYYKAQKQKKERELLTELLGGGEPTPIAV